MAYYSRYATKKEDVMLGFSLLQQVVSYVTEPPPPPKKQGFVSQDPIGGFSTKQECTNTHKSIQYRDIQVIKQLLHIKCNVLRFTKDKMKKMVQQMYQSFAEALSLMISTLPSP
jgi:hypothetical protein